MKKQKNRISFYPIRSTVSVSKKAYPFVIMTKSTKVLLNFFQKIAVLRQSLRRFPQKTEGFCRASVFLKVNFGIYAKRGNFLQEKKFPEITYFVQIFLMIVFFNRLTVFLFIKKKYGFKILYSIFIFLFSAHAKRLISLLPIRQHRQK